MAKSRASRHIALHVALTIFTLLALYPVFWVLALAFSGQQSVGLIDLPRDPSIFDRLRAIVPFPGLFL